MGLYHCECHFVIGEEEHELFWLGLDLEYLQEDSGRGLTGNADSYRIQLQVSLREIS